MGGCGSEKTNAGRWWRWRLQGGEDGVNREEGGIKKNKEMKKRRGGMTKMSLV